MSEAAIKKQRGIVWFNKTGFDFCLIGQASPNKFVFPPGIISYLEIMDETKLQEEIKKFVEQNKIPISSLILVLGADVLFEKESTINSPDQIKKTEDEFRESVPFENVYVKTWNFGTTFRHVACNVDLLNYLRIAFEQLGFDIIFAIPYFSTGKDFFDTGLAATLWKKSEQLRTEHTIQDYSSQDSTNTNMSPQKAPKHSKRELALIGLFGILLLVFFVVIYVQFFKGKGL